jgi:hypothetical protein
MQREDFLDKTRKIPIFGGLVDCTWRDHGEALGQTTVLLIVSTMPIWLGTLIVYSFGEAVGRSAFRFAFLSTISHGELLMYSTAFLAPIFWVALIDRPNLGRFPGRVSHTILMVITTVIAAVFFGLLTAGNKPNGYFIFKLSCYVFYASLVLLYLGILYHEHRIVDPGAAMKDDENQFFAAYIVHKHEP